MNKSAARWSLTQRELRADAYRKLETYSGTFDVRIVLRPCTKE